MKQTKMFLLEHQMVVEKVFVLNLHYFVILKIIQMEKLFIVQVWMIWLKMYFFNFLFKNFFLPLKDLF